jgi:hypothetical protein
VHAAEGVVAVEVSVDHEADGPIGDPFDLTDEPLRERRGHQRVNDQDAVVANNEAGVGRPCFLDEGVDAIANFDGARPRLRCGGHGDLLLTPFR